jgi:hypothetical protein
MKDKIESLINENRLFDMVPGRGQIRQISLQPDGSVNDPLGEVTRWAVSTDVNQSPMSIILKRDTSNIYGVFSWNNEEYKGRDFSGSWSVLKPKSPSLFDRLYRYNGNSLDNFSLRRINNTATEAVAEEPAVQDHITPLPQDFKQSDAAIVLIGWNRPEYMEKVVEALKANKDVEKYDVIAFLDKPTIFSELEKQGAQDKLITDSFNNVHVVNRPINFGCGWNIVAAKNQVFELGYDRVFIFEDDMIPDKTYLTFCENLLKWGQKNYGNVGAVQGWTKCLMDKATKKSRAKEVHATYTNLWGYLITRGCWETLKPDLDEYSNSFLTSTYSRRPARAILQWMSEKMVDAAEPKEKDFPIDGNSKNHFDTYFRTPPSGQDGVTVSLLHKHGFVRLAPSVNRGLYIGETGIHMDHAQYKKDRFDRVTLDNMNDSRRKNFEARNEN